MQIQKLMNKKSASDLFIIFIILLIFFIGIFSFSKFYNTLSGQKELKELSISALEKRVHYLINEERSKHGLQKLRWDNDLLNIARLYSEDMLRNNYIGHYDRKGNLNFARYEEYGYNCNKKNPNTGTGSENIALVSDSVMVFKNDSLTTYRQAEEIANKIVETWMNSPGHRKNVLSDIWKFEGIGIVHGQNFKNEISFNNQPIFNNDEKKVTNWASPHNIFVTQNFC
jgi:uncharacterized protein YkwD